MRPTCGSRSGAAEKRGSGSPLEQLSRLGPGCLGDSQVQESKQLSSVLGLAATRGVEEARGNRPYYGGFGKRAIFLRGAPVCQSHPPQIPAAFREAVGPAFWGRVVTVVSGRPRASSGVTQSVVGSDRGICQHHAPTELSSQVHAPASPRICRWGDVNPAPSWD
ncbi:hypothetical protein VUR80DRAFT_3193 [Thermomyces stellatus]